MLSLFILLSILLGLVYIFVQRRYTFWQRNKIPFVTPKFPMGNLSNAKGGKHISLQLADLYNQNKAEHRLVGLYFFLRPVMLLIDPELIRHVLIKDFQNFQTRGTYYNAKHDPLSANLFALDYDQWRPLRTSLTSTFTSAKMKFMFPTVVSLANRLVETFNEKIKTDNEVEIGELFDCFTTDVIGTCAFGIKCNSLKNPNAIFRTMGKELTAKQSLSAFARQLASWNKNLANFFGVRRFNKSVTDYFYKIVKETIEYREKHGIHRNDFMDMLIEMKKTTLTLNEVAAQCFIFFVAGHETSSVNLTFCIYELSLEENKHIKDKARREIQSVLERYNGVLTYEALADMVYCEQIIQGISIFNLIVH